MIEYHNDHTKAVQSMEANYTKLNGLMQDLTTHLMKMGETYLEFRSDMHNQLSSMNEKLQHVSQAVDAQPDIHSSIGNLVTAVQDQNTTFSKRLDVLDTAMNKLQASVSVSAPSPSPATATASPIPGADKRGESSGHRIKISARKRPMFFTSCRPPAKKPRSDEESDGDDHSNEDRVVGIASGSGAAVSATEGDAATPLGQSKASGGQTDSEIDLLWSGAQRTEYVSSMIENLRSLREIGLGEQDKSARDVGSSMPTVNEDRLPSPPLCTVSTASLPCDPQCIVSEPPSTSVNLPAQPAESASPLDEETVGESVRGTSTVEDVQGLSRSEKRQLVIDATRRKRESAGLKLKAILDETHFDTDDEFYNSEGELTKNKRLVEPEEVQPLSHTQKFLFDESKRMLKLWSEPQTEPLATIDPAVDTLGVIYKDIRHKLILRDMEWKAEMRRKEEEAKRRAERVKVTEATVDDAMKAFVSDDRCHRNLDDIIVKMMRKEEVNRLRLAQKARLEMMEAHTIREDPEAFIPTSSAPEVIKIDGLTDEAAANVPLRTAKALQAYQRMRQTPDEVYCTLPIERIHIKKQELKGFKGFTYYEVSFFRPGRLVQIMTPQDFRYLNPYDLEDLIMHIQNTDIDSHVLELARQALQHKVWKFVKRDPYLLLDLTGKMTSLRRIKKVKGMSKVTDGTVRGHDLGTPEEWFEIFYSLDGKMHYFRTDECGKVSEKQIELFIRFVKEKGKPRNLADLCAFHLQLYNRGREYMKKVWKITGAPPDDYRA